MQGVQNNETKREIVELVSQKRGKPKADPLLKYIFFSKKCQKPPKGGFEMFQRFVDKYIQS